MRDTNYIGSSVRILEIPKPKILNTQIEFLKLRAQLSYSQSNKIVSLICWGNLVTDIRNNYKINDWILIEGYLSLSNRQSLNSSSLKNVEITVLKVYPIF